MEPFGRALRRLRSQARILWGAVEALPDAVRQAVLETLALIQLEPQEVGKRLVGRMEGVWAARLGSYRVLDTVEPSRVIVRSIRHRTVAYRPPRRRGRP